MSEPDPEKILADLERSMQLAREQNRSAERNRKRFAVLAVLLTVLLLALFALYFILNLVPREAEARGFMGIPAHFSVCPSFNYFLDSREAFPVTS